MCFIKRDKNNKNLNNIPIMDKPHSYEIIKHSKMYSKLLDIYVSNTNINIIIKMVLKILFFIMTMGAMLIVIYLFYISLKYSFSTLDRFDDLNDITLDVVLSLLTIILPSISSLIVAFIKIPEIIAHYLFNVEEDNYMNDIIKNIQDYDKAMFAMEQKIDELLMNNKDQNPFSADDEIEESPISIET